MIDRGLLAKDLSRIGLERGDSVYVHSSLKSIGWIEGGADALIGAFLDVLGVEGTLAVPTHSLTFVDRVGEAYDPLLTPSVLGAFPEAVRKYPGARRSGHGSHSSAAIGAKAAYLTENHDPCFALGYESPLNRLYRMGGKVLLIGVTHTKNTSLHLAESLAGLAYNHLHYDASWGKSVRVCDGGVYEQVEFPGCSGNFDRMRDVFIESGISACGKIGNAPSQLLDMARMVNRTVEALREDPTMFLCDRENCPCCPDRKAVMARLRTI